MEPQHSGPNLRATDHHGVRVLHVLRETAIDAGNATEFLAEARKLVRGAERVVLDLGKVNFVDSAGLRSLIQLRRDLTRTGGTLALADVRDEVREILEITRLTRVIPVYSDVAAALREAKREARETEQNNACSLRLELSRIGNGRIIRVRECESIDATNVHGLIKAIARCSTERAPVGIDLRSVEYLDSVALTELARARRRLIQLGSKLALLVTASLREIILAQDRNWESVAFEREEEFRKALESHRHQVAMQPSRKVEFVDIGLLLERSANHC